MKIEKSLNKVPGGTVIIPLLLGALLNTFLPTAHEWFGGITGGFLKGSSAILFVFFFCVGVGLNLKGSGGYVGKKGLVLSGGHLLLTLGLGALAGWLLPEAGITQGVMAGFSALALVTAFSQTNGGLYISILSPYEREEDIAAFPFIAIQSGPFFTMLILGATSGVNFPVSALLSTLLPFALGMLLGNLDPDIRKKFSPGVGILLPFFMFALGYTLDFKVIAKSGLAGIIVGLAVVFISGGIIALLDRWICKSDGVAGWAQASTAGAAASVPEVIHLAAPEVFSAEMAASATAIVATSVLITAIVTPLWTNFMEKQARKKGRPVLPENVVKAKENLAAEAVDVAETNETTNVNEQPEEKEADEVNSNEAAAAETKEEPKI